MVECPPDFGVVVVVVRCLVVVVPVFVPVVVPVEVEVVPLEVLVVCCGQLSETTTAPAGSESVDSDTPWGTCSVRRDPPSSLTVTVQFAADAEGIAARPNTASAEAAATPPIASFRLLSTLPQFPPAICRGTSRQPRPRGTFIRTLLGATIVCNGEPFVRAGALTFLEVRIGMGAAEL